MFYNGMNDLEFQVLPGYVENHRTISFSPESSKEEIIERLKKMGYFEDEENGSDENERK